MPAKRIEEVITDVLREDARDHALDFVAYVRASGIPLEEGEGYWEVAYQGRTVCSILIDGSGQAPGPWTIWSDQEPGTWIAWPEGDPHAASPVDERTQAVAWAHVNPCASCGSDCSPGKRKTVLGKAFDNLCSSALAFTNPDAQALDCAKQMVAARKSDIIRSIS